jgi:hypothetical protein
VRRDAVLGDVADLHGPDATACGEDVEHGLVAETRAASADAELVERPLEDRRRRLRQLDLVGEHRWSRCASMP